MILNKVKEIMMENLSIEEESITLESTFEIGRASCRERV